MTGLDTAPRSWQDFQDNPLPGVHADYVAGCMHPLLIHNEQAFRTAIGQSRERTLFVDMLRRHYSLESLSDINPEPADAILAALSVSEWHDAATACGAMYCSSVLVHEVRAPVLRLLEKMLGESWWHWVEIGRLESGASQPSAYFDKAPETAEQWRGRIRQAGSQLLWSWRDSLDESLAAWVKLKDAASDEGQQNARLLDVAYGQKCVRRLAMTLGRPSTETA